MISFGLVDRPFHLQALAEHGEPFRFAEAGGRRFVVPVGPDGVEVERVGLHLVGSAVHQHARPILIEAAGAAGDADELDCRRSRGRTWRSGG